MGPELTQHYRIKNLSSESYSARLLRVLSDFFAKMRQKSYGKNLFNEFLSMNCLQTSALIDMEHDLITNLIKKSLFAFKMQNGSFENFKIY